MLICGAGLRKNVDFQVIIFDDEVGLFEFVEVENVPGPLLCLLNWTNGHCY